MLSNDMLYAYAAPNGVTGQPVTTFEYNDAGEVTRMRDPLNHGTENWAVFIYDTLGRKTIEQSPEAAPGQPGPLTYFIYDIRSRLANMRQVVGLPDPENSETNDLVTYHGYDKLDRHTAEQDPQGGLTLMTYDAVGNMQTLRDPVGNFTTWEFNGLNQVKKETNQLGKSRNFKHDRLGNLFEEVDRENRTRTFVYDTLSRRTAENWLDAQLNTIRTFSYAYNDAGELTTASDASSAYAHTFDDLGRVLTVDNQNTPGVPRVVLTQQYDLNGNRTQLDSTINGTADMRNSYVYDKLSRMTQLSQKGNGGNAVADKLVNFSYNAAGQFTDINRFKDLAATQEVVSAHHGYDSLGRLKDLSYKRAGENLFVPYAWTHDRVSRVTQFTSQDGTADYLYDKTSQLTTATYSNPNLDDKGYEYDANGNRKTAGQPIGANNQVLNDGTFSYTFDDEGNRETRTRLSNGAYTEFKWDHRNRLTSVIDWTSAAKTAKTQEVVYTYDVFDRRISRQVDVTGPIDLVGEAIERYLHDGDDVLLDFIDADGDGNNAALDKRYLQGAAVDQILAQEDVTELITDPDRVLWHQPDDLGTTRDLIDNAGTIIAHFQYDSFGNVIDPAAATALTRYLYTGRELDSATGLQHNRARWYDPAVGRWISEDPIGFAAGDANVNRYVGNSPTNYTDASGLRVVRPRFRPSVLITDQAAANGLGAGRQEHYMYIPDTWKGEDPVTVLNCGCTTGEWQELPLTPDQAKLVSFARGTPQIERTLAGIFNALLYAPKDFGFLAATQGYHNFGKHADLEGKGWCNSWVDAVLPTLPVGNNDLIINRVEWEYTGAFYPLYTGHAGIRLEFAQGGKVYALGYIDNGWQGGSDYIFFPPLSAVFGNEIPSTLSDGTRAPAAGPPQQSYVGWLADAANQWAEATGQIGIP